MGTISRRDLQELKWLGKQNRPCWGGHILRGEELQDNDVLRWLSMGLIELVDHRPKGLGAGYCLTGAGETFVKAQLNITPRKGEGNDPAAARLGR